ncbi:DUF4388 domain-containing protein [Vulgatibacter sp.]|uniref:DUF4388 domain-containing protein n=1 Tax=Vulgatibacter sp. TaxID=1971226 RepID=UPI0035672152
MGTGSKAYALKFISGKYQGGEFPLKADKEIVVGRSADLDMVLVEDMVSRKHARLVSSGGKVVIADLGSTNGTFVNGQRVDELELKEGDRILIGTSILKLVVQGDGARSIDAQAMKSGMGHATHFAGSGVMSGRIDEVSIPDLLQLFGASHKTGVLIVTSAGRQGRIYLRQGKVFYAVIDENHDVGPEKSFYRIVTWDSGTFELARPEETDFLVELEDSTESLLMEAMRQLDEMKRLELPSRETNLALHVPMARPLRELEGELLDVVQLVLEEGSVGGVLDKAPGSDLEIAAVLKKLIDANVVRRA